MSVTFQATLFDGKSSAGIAVEVTAREPDCIEILSAGSASKYPLAQISVSSRLADSARYLTLPSGEKLQTTDNDSVDRLLRILASDHPNGFLHAIESNWGWVGIGVAFTAIFLWWSVFIGLPALANRAAHAIPIALEDTIGEQSLSTLDTHLLLPTRLQEVQRERVRRLFATAAEHAVLERPPQLVLRRAEGLGPNAFALPSGIIVITDELAMLAEHDGELIGVIAHELGHVRHRHIMRSLLQNSAVALLLATMLGDVSSITGLAASIPTLLVETGFSRDFELEADRYAAGLMLETGFERVHLTSILTKLGTAHGADDSGLGDYLSTHPGIDKRVAAIEALEETQ